MEYFLHAQYLVEKIEVVLSTVSLILAEISLF